MKNARRFHCQPESVAGARHFVRELLSDQPRETVEAAELMTSELATNSVRHARSDFELAIHRSREEIRVEVSDHGQGLPVRRSPTPRDQSGRGLQIVQELAEDWGITSSPKGKLVWFTLRLRPHGGERKSYGAGRAGLPCRACRP
jgi:anti-sigma regulatory factor (Ser/Thr protein kinase)